MWCSKAKVKEHKFCEDELHPVSNIYVRMKWIVVRKCFFLNWSTNDGHIQYSTDYCSWRHHSEEETLKWAGVDFQSPPKIIISIVDLPKAVRRFVTESDLVCLNDVILNYFNPESGKLES